MPPDSATGTSSSDFCEDDIDGQLYGFSRERFRTSLVRPYLYEPEYTEEELQALENDQAEDDRSACFRKENTNWYYFFVRLSFYCCNFFNSVIYSRSKT